MVKSSYQNKNENTARAVGRGLPISTKQSIEICNLIRRKEVEKAKAALERVVDGKGAKGAIPFRKYTKVAHKKGIGPGKSPIKACKEILELLKEVEANAQYKGLSGELKIVHICANKSVTQWHFGRKRRRKTKRTNIEVVVEETKKKEEKGKKRMPKQKKAVEIKKEESEEKAEEK